MSFKHIASIRFTCCLLAAALLMAAAACAPSVPNSSAADAQAETTATTSSGAEDTPSPDDAPVTITFTSWAAVEESTMNNIIAIIDAFEAENPNITIDSQGIGVSDIVKELTIMCTAGNAPDISQLTSDNVQQLQAAEFLIPVDDLLSADFVSDLYADLYDATGLIDGKHYAVPWANSTHGLFYNKKLMAEAGLDPEKPPKTVQEMTEMMTIAKEKLSSDVIMLQSDTTVRTLGLFHQWPFMLAFNGGEAPYDIDTGEVNMNTPGMKEYMEWIRMLMTDGYSLPGTKYGQFRPYAAQDNLLFGNDWTTFDGTARSLNEELTPEYMYETWGATVLPCGDDGVYRTPVMTTALVLFGGSDVTPQAAKFLEFLVSDKLSIEEFIAKNGYAPVNNSATEKVPELGQNPFIKSFVEDVIPSSVTMPTGIDYNTYAEIIMSAVQEVITTDKEIDPILEDAQKKLEALF